MGIQPGRQWPAAANGALRFSGKASRADVRRGVELFRKEAVLTPKESLSRDNFYVVGDSRIPLWKKVKTWFQQNQVALQLDRLMDSRHQPWTFAFVSRGNRGLSHAQAIGVWGAFEKDINSGTGTFKSDMTGMTYHAGQQIFFQQVHYAKRLSGDEVFHLFRNRPIPEEEYVKGIHHLLSSPEVPDYIRGSYEELYADLLKRFPKPE